MMLPRRVLAALRPRPRPGRHLAALLSARYDRSPLPPPLSCTRARRSLATAPDAPPASASQLAAAEAREPPPVGRMRWSVHQAVVVERQPLADVFARLQREVRTRGLRANAVRQAVDTFYFHCARRADGRELRDPALRSALLRYFLDELFAVGEAGAGPTAAAAAPFQFRPRGRFVLGESLNEAAFAAVIRLQLTWLGDARAAWALVDRLLAAASPARLHFRTVGPILEHQCREGDVADALARWQQLKAGHCVEWTASMEDALVHMLLASLDASPYGAKANAGKATATNGEASSGKGGSDAAGRRLFNERAAALLHDLQLSSGEVSHANAQRLRAGFSAAGFATRVLPSDAAMAPACGHCGVPLAKLGVSAEERARLLAAIEARESKAGTGQTVRQHLEPFREWLLAKEAAAAGDGDGGDKKLLHYVLDGPNIAYINQNFDAGSCRLDQVDLVARRLLAQGHRVSITMPFGYLADAFVLRIRTRKMKEQRKQGRFTTRQRTAAERAIVEGWQRDGLVFSCRTDFLSDDLFWLYASVLLGDRGRVVTNDRGRDHVFALLHADGVSMDLLERWRGQAVVNIEIRHEEVADAVRHASAPPATPIAVEDARLLHPLAFSRVPQRSANDVFHLPIAPPESAAKPPASDAQGINTGTFRARVRRKWLCLARPEGERSE